MDLKTSPIAVSSDYWRDFHRQFRSTGVQPSPLSKNKDVLDSSVDDAEFLLDLGITHRQIADRLDSFVGQALDKWEVVSHRMWDGDYMRVRGKGHIIDEKFKVRAQGWTGGSDCPFSSPDVPPCASGNNDFEIKNYRLGKAICFAEFYSHVVRDHLYFGGVGLPRIEPKELIDVLEIKPGADYAPLYLNRAIWQGASVSRNPDVDFEGRDKFLKNAELVVKVRKNAHMYVVSDAALLISYQDDLLKRNPLIRGEEVRMNCRVDVGQMVFKRRLRRYVSGRTSI